MPKRLSDEERKVRAIIENLKTHDVQKIGEHAVAVECYKRGWKADILSGGTPIIDVLVWNPELERSISVQIKSRKVRRKGWNLTRLPSPEKIRVPIVAVFIEILSVDEKIIEHNFNFYVIPPEEAKRLLKTISEEYQREHPDYQDYWIESEDLAQFKDRWDLLWEGARAYEEPLSARGRD